MTLRALLIAVSVIWIYSPALHGDWLMDDALYLTNNSLLSDPARLWKAWFQPGSFIEYYPIQESVQWLQWQLWSNHPFGYHVTNVFLHFVSALLVWRLFDRMRLPLAWVGGLLFAVHPIAVESVAWIAELKNSLSLPPFLLAMCAWIEYDEKGRSKDYFLAIAFFLLAMLCKISMAPFPLVLLLYAWWRRGRIQWHDLKAGAPFFAISLVLGLTTIWAGVRYAEHSKPFADVIPIGGLLSHLALSGLSISFYLSKCLVPLSLSFTYPQWPVNPPSLQEFLPWPVLICLMGWFSFKRRTWGRHALLPLGFFLIMVAPFTGFNTVSYMNFTWVMDHFVYIPLLGPIGLVVAASSDLDRRLEKTARYYFMALVGIVAGLFAAESRLYAGMFVDQETLWTHTLEINPESAMAHDAVGNALLEKGQVADAIVHFNQGLKFSPNFAPGYNNLGGALLKAGKPSAAVPILEQALRLDPDFAEAHYNLGSAWLRLGRTSDAAAEFQQALRCNSNYVEAHYNLGTALSRLGQIDAAMVQFNEAIRLNPQDAGAHNNLGNALLSIGRCDDAIKEFGMALKINPDLTEAHYNWGNALIQTGQMPLAMDQYQAALRSDPNYTDAHVNLGTALLQSGHTQEAIEQYRDAIKIAPDLAEAHTNLGTALITAGQIAEGKKEYEEALQIDPRNSEARTNLARLNKTN